MSRILILALGAALGCIAHNMPEKISFDSKIQKMRRRRRWLQKNRSWVLKNLFSNKKNQELALNYITAQISNENQIYDGVQYFIRSKKTNRAKNPQLHLPSNQTTRISWGTSESCDFQENINLQAASESNLSSEEISINSDFITPTMKRDVKCNLQDSNWFKIPKTPNRNNRLKVKRLSGDLKHSTIMPLSSSTRTGSGGMRNLSKRQKKFMF